MNHLKCHYGDYLLKLTTHSNSEFQFQTAKGGMAYGQTASKFPSPYAYARIYIAYIHS